MRRPRLEDYGGDYSSYSDACQEYDDHLSDKEDAAKEKYYNNKYSHQ